MSEIANGTPNDYKMVSTFSGCGGTCLGFKMDGYRTLWANEFIDIAAQVYRLNHPDVIVDTQDIRNVMPARILSEIGMKAGELDVFEGSPPCASFSLSGKRAKTWGLVKTYSETKQRVDDLFWEYARILEGLQPKVFVAENVSGLVQGAAKGYFKEIFARLKDAGYKVQCRVLDASWLGVPQARKRAIFIGVRRDLSPDPAFPRPFSYQYTLRDVLPEQASMAKHYDRKDSLNKDAERLGFGLLSPAQIPEWVKLKPGQASTKFFNLRKSSFDKPSPTILAVTGQPAAGATHPIEMRKFTIPELKRVCSFPDDFQLIGKYPQQWERLGRAVPPLMARVIAQTIRKEILDKC
jgi:DNA (cytosine-5)-methyltransferase 1